jgi:hypothetical protein
MDFHALVSVLAGYLVNLCFFVFGRKIINPVQFLFVEFVLVKPLDIDAAQDSR